MSSPIYRHDLDPTGLSPDNRVLREPVTLANYPVRVFVPSFGAFFGDSMVITDTATGAILLKSQYYLSQPAHIPTLKYGKGIYYCVVITDASVSANLNIDYQDLGGEWAYSNSALANQLQAVLGDARAVDYSSVINKPDRFSPGAHLHDAGDLFGMEYLVEAMYAIRDAVTMDNTGSMISIYDRTVAALDVVAASVQTVRTDVYGSINALLDQISSLQLLANRVAALENGTGSSITYITTTQLNDALAQYAATHPSTTGSSVRGIPGEVAYFATNVPPAGWLLADGWSYWSTDYPELFAAIGTLWGANIIGEAVHFAVPDLRGEFIRGADLGRGVDIGRLLGSYQSDAFKLHTHQTPTTNGVAGNFEVGRPDLNDNPTGYDFGIQSAQTSTEGGAAETRPRNIVLLPCICYTANAVVTPPINATPTYAIYTATSILNAGNTAGYSITTTNVPDGTVLYWTVTSFTLDARDFTDNAAFGSVTINSNSATLTRTLDAVLLNGGNDLFSIDLRTTSITGPVIASSAVVRTMPAINATYQIAPNMTSVDEGSTVTFTVTTTGVANGIVLGYLITGSAVGADFVDGMLEGAFTINNNTGSFVKAVSADALTDGSKVFAVSVTPSVGSGTTLATSTVITINDTSTAIITPSYVITPDVLSVNALGQVTFTLTRTNGVDPAGTTYYFDASGADLTCITIDGALPNVYSATRTKVDGSNPTLMISNTGYSTLNNSGNDQNMLVNLRSGGHTGAILASSPLVALIIDTQN